MSQPDKHYAKRKIKNPSPPPRQSDQYAHRVVLERMIGRKLVKGEYSDHINRDKLDNRRENLRVVNATENLRNRNRWARGITFNKRAGKWQAQLNGKYIGVFATEEEALRDGRWRNE